MPSVPVRKLSLKRNSTHEREAAYAYEDWTTTQKNFSHIRAGPYQSEPYQGSPYQGHIRVSTRVVRPGKHHSCLPHTWQLDVPLLVMAPAVAHAICIWNVRRSFMTSKSIERLCPRWFGLSDHRHQDCDITGNPGRHYDEHHCMVYFPTGSFSPPVDTLTPHWALGKAFVLFYWPLLHHTFGHPSDLQNCSTQALAINKRSTSQLVHVSHLKPYRYRDSTHPSLFPKWHCPGAFATRGNATSVVPSTTEWQSWA